MKKLLYITILSVCSFFVVDVSAQGVDMKLSMFVTDIANMIPDDIQAAIEAKLTAFNASTSNQIVIVTIPKLPSDQTIETFAYELFQNNEIGQKDKNNGLLFLISLEDRKNRFEVGYGLEGVLPDSLTDIIRRENVTPAFQAGDYGKGVNDAVDRMIDIVSRGEVYVVDEGMNVNPSDWFGILFFVFFILTWIITLFASVFVAMSKTRSVWLGFILGLIGSVILYFVTGVVFVFIIAIFGLVVDWFFSGKSAFSKSIISYLQKMNSRSRGPGGMWGGSSGGWGSGGGGGFSGGGGRSGGGGSSGGW